MNFSYTLDTNRIPKIGQERDNSIPNSSCIIFLGIFIPSFLSLIFTKVDSFPFSIDLFRTFYLLAGYQTIFLVFSDSKP